MTSLPAVNVGDYVVARHKNGDEIRSMVLGTYRPFPGKMRIEVRAAPLTLDCDEWSFEPAERPQPPVEEGIWQHKTRGEIRFVRGGYVYDYSDRLTATGSDLYEYGYVGPEVSR